VILMRTHLSPREIADRVLSGVHVVVELDPTKREIKHCEYCPATFVRIVGTDKKYCGHCDPQQWAPPQRNEKIRRFSAGHIGTSRAYRQGRRARA
jgi:hypothetical protein